MAKQGNEKTLYDVFCRRVARSKELPAYSQFENGRWVTYTWAQTADLVSRWRAAYRASGLQPGDRVALCARNSIDWVCFDLAAIAEGLVTVPLYFGDRAENMAWSLSDSGTKLLFLQQDESWTQLKQESLGDQLQHIVCAFDPGQEDARAVSFASWLPAQGAQESAVEVKPDDLMTIVYTSGTTGKPKGVMLTHMNILSNVLACLEVVDVNEQDSFVSFLPLSHMFERTTGFYVGLMGGGHTYYARGITELKEDLAQHKPTIMICVPRIFERIYTAIQTDLKKHRLKAVLFGKAVAIGWRRFEGNASLTDNLLWPVLNLLVAKKLRRRLGGRLRVIVTGGASLGKDLGRTFVGLGLNVLQGYGLTETAPVICANRMDDNDPTSVGRPLSGIEVKLGAQNELLTRGPNVMRGYWNNESATAAVIDQDKWLHTGDIADIRNERIYITGRLKEVIVMSNGEKVPPADIEQAILMDPVFEHVMLVGEGRGHMGLLVVSQQQNVEELCRRANAQLHNFPGYAKIFHLACVQEPWTVEDGALTPSMKLKRRVIEQRYAKEIEAMFERKLCD